MYYILKIIAFFYKCIIIILLRICIKKINNKFNIRNNYFKHYYNLDVLLYVTDKLVKRSTAPLLRIGIGKFN